MSEEEKLAYLHSELLECARYGEEDDLRLILQEKGVDVNYADPDLGNTALHRAAANGEVTCMAILFKAGAQHNANFQGNYPIHWAALNGKPDSLQFLFDHYECDVLIQNQLGRSTLTEAFQSQSTSVIELCL